MFNIIKRGKKREQGKNRTRQLMIRGQESLAPS